MDDPIKIIFKFKNSNRRHQHHVYVYIGDVDDDVMKILEKIRQSPLYLSWTELSKANLSVLIKKYGEFWYKKFFVTHHIDDVLSQVKNSSLKQKELVSKFGAEWYNRHIREIVKEKKQLFYSYQSVVRSELIRDEQRRKKFRSVNVEGDIELADYTTDDKALVQTAGDKDDDKDDKDGESGYPYTKEADDDGDGVVEFNEGLDHDTDLLLDEDIGLDDIDQIYKDADVETEDDKSLKKTTDLIKDALQDSKIFLKEADNLIPFDTSKDDVRYDENLKDVYVKNYVTNQYIFKDDTIKTIKNKICCSVLNNQKFGKSLYIPPSRQYLWSEYTFQDKLDKVMIGQKWIKRTELLHIDVEPNRNLRIYEELRGNLKYLKDNIKRYGTKIRWEDDDYTILYTYDSYFTNNELFMIDVYNEIGKGYSADEETLDNIYDVYMRVYFHRLSQDDLTNIVEYLKVSSNVDQKDKEAIKITSIYENINNDTILENEIMKTVEDVKTEDKYLNLFKENFITQATIHIDLRDKGVVSTDINFRKINLFRIFDSYIVDDTYPFIQYHTSDGQIIFKFSDKDLYSYRSKKENLSIIAKWFENVPPGISFKIKIKEGKTSSIGDSLENKFIAINLNENGRINYKIQWTEKDKATIKDTEKTYIYVTQLLQKINIDKNSHIFELPEHYEFKYAFLNTIQQFVLPDKFTINHNDLSEFARYFFPYVDLVIAPRKRQAKVKKGSTEGDGSKFGTYLKYKRVSKYENQAKIEQRILYYMRNYEYNDLSLSDEIAKQFNITMDRAMAEIVRTKNRHPKLKRSRKILKTLDTIPKYKSPGIEVAIQGKLRENYKIRISGARDRAQLDRINTFINILIYLYMETYLYKRPKRQKLKEKLKLLTNVARRRNLVAEIVNYEKSTKSLKQMESLDKRRIGFKPEKGQHGWTRSCQNSGDDKRRRPKDYSSVQELLQDGFKLNNTSNLYEKSSTLKDKDGKKIEITLKAVALEDKGKTVYYSCNPKEHGDHSYIGFLSKSSNPYGLCMPCCFKKDASESASKSKRDYFWECVGKKPKKGMKGVKGVKGVKEIKKGSEKIKEIVDEDEDEDESESKSEEYTEETSDKIRPLDTADKLYILQDTNKIQSGKFGFLPNYMDFFFNQAQDKTRKIVKHYLVTTKDGGYFFKYGVAQSVHPLVSSVAAILNMSLVQVMKKMLASLEKDRSDVLFTSLNNGDIRTQFGTRDKYISFIQTNQELNWEAINHIMCTPGVLTDKGLNLIAFNKQSIKIQSELEKTVIRDDFTIICQNLEELEYLKDSERQTAFLIKEDRNYYPVFKVTKRSDSDKNVSVNRTFTYNDPTENIVKHIEDYYYRNCKSNILLSDDKEIPGQLTAKETYKILTQLGGKHKDFLPKFQNIDARNRCKYLITNNSTIIPVKPSGSIYNLNLLKNLQGKVLPLKQTLSNIIELYDISNKVIPIKPVGVYYKNKISKDANIVGVMTKVYGVIPVEEETVTVDSINKQGLVLEHKHIYDRIDEKIDLLQQALEDNDTRKLSKMGSDERTQRINFNTYYNESYELFRLHFSKYINDPDNELIRKKIIRAIHNKTSMNEKRATIKKILYRIVDKRLLTLYEESTNKLQTGGKYDKFVHLINKLPDLTNYKIDNNRVICNEHDTKNCDNSVHCRWAYEGCYLALTKDMAIVAVNKISEELAANELKASELFNREGYYVSDIVNFNNFTEREGQVVVRSNNFTIAKVLEDIFGSYGVPTIGKKSFYKTTEISVQQMNEDNPIKDMGDFYVQSIINNNMSVLRAYVNCYYWMKLKYYDLESRNLGYYSPLQTNIANYFRSVVIDWLVDSNNTQDISNNLISYISTDLSHKHKQSVKEFIFMMTKDVINLTNGVVEYYVLNKIHKIPVIVYDRNNDIVYIFDNGVVYDKKLNNTKPAKYTDSKSLFNYIHIRYTMVEQGDVPTEIEVLYFKPAPNL